MKKYQIDCSKTLYRIRELYSKVEWHMLVFVRTGYVK